MRVPALTGALVAVSVAVSSGVMVACGETSNTVTSADPNSAALGSSGEGRAPGSAPPSATSSPSGSAYEDCRHAAASIAAAASGPSAAGRGDLPTPEEAGAQLRRLADAAPDVLGQDFDVVGQALATFYASLEAADVDLRDTATFASAAKAAAVAKAGERFNAAAGPSLTRIQARLGEICG